MLFVVIVGTVGAVVGADGAVAVAFAIDAVAVAVIWLLPNLSMLCSFIADLVWCFCMCVLIYCLFGTYVMV